MLLDGLRVVLLTPRFPENIGMTARAMANMGCPELHLINPERFDYAKAQPLATRQGEPILKSASVHKELATALAETNYVLGTTARRGGWRRRLLSPNQAAANIAESLALGEKVALLFGPEDRGLENSHLSFCQDLVTIPTDAATSLNLAQAVLLMLYVCAEAVRKPSETPKAQARTITQAELELFLNKLKETLLNLDCLHGDNVDYFFLPWKQLFGRLHLRRAEFDALMGLCRQIKQKIGRNL